MAALTFLRGVRVLDLSHYIPGPFASLMLADLGAEVVKIEPPAGDTMRMLGPRDAAGRPVFHRALNAGKSLINLDLKSDAGRAAFLALVDDADVLIEGFRPGVMGRLGVDYATLSARRPGLIYCSISGYGPEGPLADMAAHDANYLATGGIIDRNADFFDPPVADMAGALFAMSAILAALHGRHLTGRGTHIDIGLADSVMPLQLLHIAEHAANGTVPEPRSSYLNGGAAYYQVYATADAQRVMLGPVEPKFWRNFCIAAGREDWIARQDEAMPQDELIADVAALFAGLTRDAAIKHFAGVDCCLSPVLDLAEAVAAPQLAARGLVRRHEGDLQALFPARFDGRGSGPRAALVEVAR